MRAHGQRERSGPSLPESLALTIGGAGAAKAAALSR